MGQGIISVSTALFEQQKQPQTLAEWHALLRLPEEYRLLEVKVDAVYPLWLLTVENEAIPEVEGKLPDVTPIFRAEHDFGIQTAYLDRIEVNKPSHCVIWPYTREVKTQGISLRKKGQSE